MIKLDYMTPRKGLHEACEYWNIDDDIKVELTRFNGYALLGITYLKRDIADQVYDQIKSMDCFSDVELDALDRYILFVPFEKIDRLLQHIEQIDRSKLSKGFVF